MEPVSTVTTAWTVIRTTSEVSKKLNEVWKNLKDRDAKRQVEEILDKLHELKQSASQLEDENRELRERLRFKGEDYEFRNPFYYDKVHKDRPLCAKCFANYVAAPMGEEFRNSFANWRKCLVCGNLVEDRPVRFEMPHEPSFDPDT